jgi:prepilin-type N-terminal cleavage/methylation domain-containing protein
LLQILNKVRSGLWAVSSALPFINNLKKILINHTPFTTHRPPDAERGFSLIESIVATAIISIGFIGVYSMVALSEQFTKWAMARQKLQLYANQMLDVIEADISNNSATPTYITNYGTVNLTNCTDPAPATATYLVRSYEWCTRMNANVAPATAGDIRSITVTQNPANSTEYWVLIRLEAYGAKAQIIMAKTYVTS